MTGTSSDTTVAAAMRSSLEPALICGRGISPEGATPITGVALCGGVGSHGV
jgi:hypothetical protein